VNAIVTQLTKEEKATIRAEIKACYVKPVSVAETIQALEESAITKWGTFIHANVERLANSQDYADRMQAGWLAALEAYRAKLDACKTAFRLRDAIAMGKARTSVEAAPFSSLVKEDEDGEEMEFDVADHQMAMEFMDGLDDEIDQDLLHLGEDEHYINLAESAMAKALANGDKERFETISAALDEFKATVRMPDTNEDDRPMFKFDPPKAEKGGKGEYQLLAEEYEEQLSEQSDVFCTDEERVSPMPIHAGTVDPEIRPDVELFPRQSWKALRKSWGKFDFGKVLTGVFAELDLGTDTDKAWALRYYAQNLVNNGLCEDRSEMYEVAVPALGLPAEWIADGIESQEDIVGEDVVESAAGEHGRFSDILYGMDYEGWKDPELEEMEWPMGTLSFESVGGKPWETKVYLEAFVQGAMYGASWKEAAEAGMDAWHRARLSKAANRMRIAGEDKSTVNAVDYFTRTNDGLVVGLLPSGIKVNGKGTVETLPWEMAIPNASKIRVQGGREKALVAKCKEMGGQANIFALALESAVQFKYDVIKANWEAQRAA
jgi:hypothetical protein